MAFEAIPDEVRSRIANAPSDVTDVALSEQLGISRPTIAKYRKQAREQRAEAARTVLVERVSRETPNALAALSDCVSVAHRKMLETEHPDYVRECRASAKTLLDYLGLAPETDELDEVPNESLIDEVRRRLGPGNL